MGNVGSDASWEIETNEIDIGDVENLMECGISRAALAWNHGKCRKRRDGEGKVKRNKLGVGS